MSKLLGQTMVPIAVDPHTAQLTVTTDPLPSILAGVPTDLRTIDAVIDRPEFMFDPTNCAPRSFSGTATSTEGTVAAISSPFQVGSCQSLQFKPDFKVSTSGKTSRKDGASLDAKIVYPTGALGANQASGQANVASVKVDLPKQLPSRLTTLQKACLAVDKRLKGRRTRAWEFLAGVFAREPGLFAHWRVVRANDRMVGAV